MAKAPASEWAARTTRLCRRIRAALQSYCWKSGVQSSYRMSGPSDQPTRSHVIAHSGGGGVRAATCARPAGR
ncbi:TetR/AcrR family transcriptional regulator C-terminal domain-containing protein [Azospirillum sp. TSH100]|uniref:TetR/AcrR family transcriptional regulator C-terminal domain-containing protein n=1 Tax=Azospirillum sp. TSH100 TaxID=652764 RepID=UPI001304D74B